jgi:hypothetical protein
MTDPDDRKLEGRDYNASGEELQIIAAVMAALDRSEIANPS